MHYQSRGNTSQVSVELKLKEKIESSFNGVLLNFEAERTRRIFHTFEKNSYYPDFAL